MTSLGLDLSLTATASVLLVNGEMKDYVLIKTKPSGKNPTDELNRLLLIRERLMIDDVTPDIVVVEGLAFMARNTTALVQLSGLNYLVRELLWSKDIPFVIVSPSTLKKFVTGKGNAKKDQMLLETYKRYNVSFEDDNLCDAFGLAKIGEALSAANPPITKEQDQTIEILRKQL